MMLPGRLSIAYIEEDHPVKAYFRVRPLLVSEQDRIEMFQEADGIYPSQGYIRVVPDKNEISLFKNRMHLMGRYCLLDLRRYPGENEKIRPNKNFNLEGGDANAFIIYSDVIQQPAVGLLTEVVDLPVPEGETVITAAHALPGTACVALRSEGKCTGPWKWACAEEEGMITFTKVAPGDWAWPDADTPAGICISIPVPGAEQVPTYINLSVLDRAAIHPSAYSAPIYVASAEPQALPVLPAASAPEGAYGQGVPAVPAAIPAAAVRQEQPDPAIPLTTHRAINARITMREQALLAQMGVSPRRGRSLYEIVDEKWRKSRIDQLGHPIPLEATGSPANDPIENAMTAIRAVLPMPEARSSLIEEMLRNETLNDALTEVFGAKRAAARQNDARMTEMEAERLALSAEIDGLKRKREAERSRILEEVRAEYAIEFDRLDRKKEQLNGEIKSLRETEQTARAAAETAVEALNRTLKEDIDGKLLENAMAGRARCLLSGMRGDVHVSAPKPVTTDPTAGELFSDVRSYFDRAGRPICHDDAVNMLACLTLGRTLIVSGPVGSGKRDTIRLLASALGVSYPGSQRFAITSDLKRAEKMISDGTLVSDDEALSMLLLVSANAQKDVRASVNAIYNAETRRSNGLRPIMSIDDAPDAYPVTAGMYDRAFTLRLARQGADMPWKPADVRPTTYGQTVSLAALQKIFEPKNDLPVEMEMRMTAIRERLDKLGTPITRRSLDALWRYCSAVLPYMQHTSPLEILDLAISQRGLPTLLSSMPLEALMELPEIFKGMDRCMKLLDEPLPLPALY